MNAPSSTPPSFTIREIAFSGYPVTDVSRARAFYQDLLGLRPGATFEHEGRQWIEYDIGPHTLAISNMSAEQWKPSADGPCIALEVDDFDAAITALRHAGTRFVIDPMESGFCRMAIVLDPDGNSLCIHQRNPPRAAATAVT